MNPILLIDNYDSFTYNLAHVFFACGISLEIKKNDDDFLKNNLAAYFQAIVISPGPGRPEAAGHCERIISRYYKSLPILGVCLGHQALGEFFGAKLHHAPDIMHGKTSKIFHDGQTLFKKIQLPFTAMRYHSLILDKERVPSCFEVSAWTAGGDVMGVRHKEFPLEGVQFHPESILTKEGNKIIKNFLVFNKLTVSSLLSQGSLRAGEGL